MTAVQTLKRNEARVAPQQILDDLATRTRAVRTIAADHAEAVDRDSRFPSETFEAIRARGLLGVMIPKEFGGEGANLREVADICYAIGAGCSSSGMIYAMHQTKVACIVRHGQSSPWQRQVLRHIAERQLLMASSTTEGQNGGNIRSSAAAIEREGDSIFLERMATCISYGEQADGLVTTARRAPDAINSDQVLAVFLKEDYALEPIVGWQTMGMRGTCSAGFKVKAKGVPGQIVPEPYETIHSRTMMPTAHVLWSSVWAGIAANAVERARLFLRNAARHSQGELPPGAAHYTQAAMKLKALRALIAQSAQAADDADARTADSAAFQTSMTMLKVNASETAVAIGLSAMRACGLSGYRNDGDFSVSRPLRDLLSSPIMINNDRILGNLTAASLLDETPPGLND